MATSYRALGDEHRQILIALLDAPAGTIDERGLAAAVRRHRPGGFSAPMRELIDRLTDHFLRVTPLGIGWVHPSWRDLVIDELGADVHARRQFLSATGIDGVLLALSRSGGSTGERVLPLLSADDDWDRLAERLHQLSATLEDRDLARLLIGLRDTLAQPLAPGPQREVDALAAQLLEAIADRRAREPRVLSGALVEAWYGLERVTPQSPGPLPLTWTWVELHPGSPGERGLDHDALNQLDDWLTLVEILTEHEPVTLKQLGFFDADQQLIPQLIGALERTVDVDERELSEALLVRIQQLAPRHREAADAALTTLEAGATEWWSPPDLMAPPTRELVEDASAAFTRDDVARVLADLD